ncbi:WD domain [Trypanosoma vivax]|nr:WD domain [Trypanosoma vivax]
MCAAILISASYDKQIRFWDRISARTVRCFSFQDSQVNALLLIPETTYLAVAGFGVVRLYDIGIGNATTSSVCGVGAQAPPLFSSYENQSAMNITSLGSFPLHPQREDPLMNSCSTDGSSIALSYTVGDFSNPVAQDGNITSSGLLTVLYATSEDGHVRFFNANSPTTLTLLRDISTGAAITCSALSPDRKTFFTGSQIGRVSVWHLPSIIDAVMQPPEKRKSIPFSNVPIQEIAFDKDYTAIRSIAVEPLAQWAVAATNAGKLHFIRFSKNGRNAVSPMSDEDHKGKLLKEGLVEERERTNPSCRSGMDFVGADNSGTTKESSTRSAQSITTLQPSTSCRPSPLSGDLRGNTHGSDPPAQGVGSPAAARGDPRAPDAQAGIAPPNAEPNDRTRVSSVSSTHASPLLQQFTTEVFHSFQAHHKYILKVAISPDTKLLVTCCADYTIGRFLIPPELRRCDFRMVNSAEDDLSVTSSIRSPRASTFPVALEKPIVTDGDVAANPVGAKTEDGAPTNVVLPPQAKGVGCTTIGVCAETKKSKRLEGSATVSAKDGSRAGVTATVPSSSDAISEVVKAVDTAKPSTELTAPVAEIHSTPFLTMPGLPPLGAEGNGSANAAGTIEFKDLKPLVGHSRWVWDGVFSDCGRYFFTASSDNSLRMWVHVQSDHPQSTCFTGHTKPVICCILYIEKKRS